MRITRIEIEGQDGYFATIARSPDDQQIVITILTPRFPNGQERRIPADATEAEFLYQARDLQRTLDGFAGTSGDIASYHHQLRSFAN